MTTRELLHGIVDELHESNLVTAVRVLKGLELAPTPLEVLLANAPLDDEADDDDFDGGLTESREDVLAGRTIPHAEVMRRLGIEK
ncbi:MAG TPA: hypothetical protein VHX14_24030 [Thermoanaerobaculia bacterium]|jgi:hypothetical protein|nr:hypothetical protein [Thermoanaerobaculia bacterium]